MNAIIAKNMEAIFAVAVTLSLTVVFLTTEAPVIEVNVTGPAVTQTSAHVAANVDANA